MFLEVRGAPWQEPLRGPHLQGMARQRAPPLIVKPYRGFRPLKRLDFPPDREVEEMKRPKSRQSIDAPGVERTAPRCPASQRTDSDG